MGLSKLQQQLKKKEKERKDAAKKGTPSSAAGKAKAAADAQAYICQVCRVGFPINAKVRDPALRSQQRASVGCGDLRVSSVRCLTAADCSTPPRRLLFFLMPHAVADASRALRSEAPQAAAAPMLATDRGDACQGGGSGVKPHFGVCHSPAIAPPLVARERIIAAFAGRTCARACRFRCDL